MKLRKPWMINLASFFASGVLRGWMSTVRAKVDSLGQLTDPWDPQVRERFIDVFWHEYLLTMGRFRTVVPMTFLISRSADGELVSQVCNRIGVATVRGSSSNGGVEAIEELAKIGKTSHIAIAPDGPRGPRRVVKRGIALFGLVDANASRPARYRLPSSLAGE